MRLNRQNIAKTLSAGIMLMGIVHIAATFTPVIADKLAMLPAETQGAFTYFSIMCGALLILGGDIIFTLSEKVAEATFVRKPYILALAILNIDGVLAICYMRHNPCAWIIFALTMCLLLVNVKRLDK